MKTIVLLMVLIAALSASAAETKVVCHSCCAASTEKNAASACLSDKSLYQLDSVWTNDAGAAVKLSSLRGRPQIVAMFFANCTYACPLLVYQMKQMEAALPASLRGRIGFTLISFDSERDTATALHQYRQQHGLNNDRWTLLRGGPEDVIEVAALLNVKFKKDAQGQYLHSNQITLLNAEGEIAYQELGLSMNRDELIHRATELVSR
jgi:protein SCO1/2